MIGYVNKIETLGLHDGPGIRVVVFMQGCPMRCIYCHNPEMFEYKKGKEYTPKELVSFIVKYKNYFKEDGGVTFSGGEALGQYDFLLETCKLLKENNINIALDTCGIGLKSVELLKYIDIILMDIKHIQAEEYKYLTARDTFKESLKFLEKIKGKRIWFRQVILPGINDSKEYIIKLKEFTKQYKPERTDLLPYHTMGKNKYEELNIPYKLKDMKAMDNKKVKELEKYL